MFLLIFVASPDEQARAAEGGASHYLPGTAGDIFIAESPQPGLLITNLVWVQSGNAGAAVLQGRIDLGLDTTTVLDIVGAAYTVESPALGGTYTAALAVPFGYANLDATITVAGPQDGVFRGSENSFNLSDIVLIPLQMNWKLGEFRWKFAETITAPTGAYDVEDVVNLGRNYWSFDTIGAATWFNAETGTEISAAPGIMVNTTNNATDYHTGSEFHLDFTVNQFFSKTFAFGLRGYYYQQVSGDSGSGARLGPFESESLGIGPGVFWAPQFAGGKLSILAKWLHDLNAQNRFKNDYGTVAVAWQF